MLPDAPPQPSSRALLELREALDSGTVPVRRRRRAKRLLRLPPALHGEAAADRVASALLEGEPNPPIRAVWSSPCGRHWVASFEFDPQTHPRLAGIPGARWARDEAHWTGPITPASAKALRSLVSEPDLGIAISAADRALLANPTVRARPATRLQLARETQITARPADGRARSALEDLGFRPVRDDALALDLPFDARELAVLAQRLQDLDVDTDPDLTRRLRDPTPTGHLVARATTLTLEAAYSEDLLRALRALGSAASWNPTNKTWTLKISDSSRAAVRRALIRTGPWRADRRTTALLHDPQAQAATPTRTRRTPDQLPPIGPGGIRALSEATAHPNPAAPAALRELLDSRLAVQSAEHQWVGAHYIAATGAGLLADDQGAGKSLTAILGLEVARALPALIVVPSWLRAAWPREIAAALPDRSVRTIATRTPFTYNGEDYLVVTADVVADHLPTFTSVNLGGLVVDEAECLINPRARRAQAIRALTRKADSPVTVLITSTPVRRRPADLANLLRTLGHLDRTFGGYDTFVRTFQSSRPVPTPGTSGAVRWVHGTAQHLTELHEQLRAAVMIRRTTRQLMPELGPTQRHVLWLPNAHDRECQAANAALAAVLARAINPEQLRALRAHARDDADLLLRARAAVRRRMSPAHHAQALLLHSELRKLIGLGKVPAIIDLLSAQSPIAKTLVFAKHVAVQDRLVRAFPDAARLTHDVRAGREAEHVDRFQTDPNCRLLIAGFEKGARGHTLTAATHVVFAELDTIAGVHEHAERRAHARLNDPHPITSIWALADGSNEQRLLAMLGRQHALLQAVRDGIPQPPGTDTDPDLASANMLASLL
ncbi:hypothetical protein GKE82_23835 [Conexibacter sp. W3-3-2]|uniref:SNF2-related protein n=1 Tax=Conexibacter sp. W3-3-2 TaxID=2675227 RepID=UPI0012B88E58|nr:DEAD/DEAH box helicase [Conexibacter sp. W3-3-2]MTD47238.1 hypothetical protein [Conexibacter sp. W3-3-2]